MTTDNKLANGDGIEGIISTAACIEKWWDERQTDQKKQCKIHKLSSSLYLNSVSLSHQPVQFKANIRNYVTLQHFNYR